MPVQIGARRESAFDNPIGLLTDCEEDSLFPRLRSIDRATVQRALASIDGLESDHAAAALRHAELNELGQRWLESGSLNKSDGTRFNSVAQEQTLSTRRTSQ